MDTNNATGAVVSDDDKVVVIGDSEKEIELNDDMTFDKPVVPQEAVKLQKEVVEFVTSVIIKHEEHLTKIVMSMHSDSNMVALILGSTHAHIIEMIVALSNDFYNSVYKDVQAHIVDKKEPTDLVKLVVKMSGYAKYGPHILLEKLIRYTVDCHTEIIREDLDLFDTESYKYSVLDQINTFIKKNPPLHLFSRRQTENRTEFVVVPDGERAFNVSVSNNQ